MDALSITRLAAGMYALKSLVVVLSVLILISMALLGWGVYSKVRDPEFTLFGNKKSEAPAAPAVLAGGAFGDIRLPVAPGCVLEGSSADGGRLFLHVGPAGPCARVFVVDPSTGRILGSFAVVP